MARIQFLGAAGTVTGSKTHLEHDGQSLLVDCGLFQGLKQLRLRNWSALPVERVDAVVLTHAHLDHSGWLPRLVELGFDGKVFATAATIDLCRILLPDAGRLAEEEARYANRHRFSKHTPALPLFTEAAAQAALRQFERRDFDSDFGVLPGIGARFTPAGHILGAASVHLRCGGASVLFSGDLGRGDDLVMKPPQVPPAADHVVIESTYGDRSHPPGDPLDELAAVISRTAARGGMVLVPAFAVGRAQALLLAVQRLKAERRIPDLPLFLNSPMAADVTSLLSAHGGEHRLSTRECQALAAGVRIVNSEDESRALNDLRVPALIVAASGMATGGRVVHHLKAFAPDPRNTIALVGHQAAGTRGAALRRGEAQIRIHGEWIPVHAEVVALGGWSAHADREGLLDWLGALPAPPRQVWVTHGEPEAADALRQAVEERWRWRCAVPEYRDCFELDPGQAPRADLA